MVVVCLCSKLSQEIIHHVRYLKHPICNNIAIVGFFSVAISGGISIKYERVKVIIKGGDYKR